MILILDFGSQTTPLIARRVRELGEYSEIKPWNFPALEIAKMMPKGIIISGSPRSVLDEDAPLRNADFWDIILYNKIPTLGICYGMQMMAKYFDGKISKASSKEYGKAQLVASLSSLIEDSHYIEKCPIRQSLQSVHRSTVWFSHGDSVIKLPLGFEKTGVTDQRLDSITMMEDKEYNLFGVQFHPEVVHTEYGSNFFKKFLDICKCNRDYTVSDVVVEQVKEIKEQVGEEDLVLCALSGGVDSTVAAALVNNAIGKRLHCVYVDTGYMRLNESDEIMDAYKEMDLNVTKIDASALFYQSLKGISDPEQKRKIIGKLFIDIFEQFKEALESREKTKISYITQGTLLADIIESGSNDPSSLRVVIKSHHNVGGLPKKMNLKLIEPLRDMFKDEVRKVGKLLNIPEKILNRHPFPGPGLAIRIIGETTPEDVLVLQKADFILRDEVEKAGLTAEIWQLFAVLLPVRTVGVQGDERTYGRMIVIRAVVGEDAMSMSWYRMPYDVLEKISTRITNEIKEINRVVYDCSNKPPSSIEFE